MTHPLAPLTFPLHGTRLIEASAGTGKTYTIAALYLRLVLGHGEENAFPRALTPPEILVMTFTNAATQELRDRIRKRLTEAAAFFRDSGEGDLYLQALRKTYPEGKRLGCARILDQAAQWMDEAAIYTIHSWSQRMLRQHAFDSGSLFDLELEPEDQDLLEEAACDYWRCNLYPLTPEALKELQSLIKCPTPQALLSQVRPLLNAPLDPPDDPYVMLAERVQVIEKARIEWAPLIDEGITQIRQAMKAKALSGSKYKPHNLEDWQNQLTSWVQNHGPLPDKTARQKLSISALKASLNKNQSMPEHPAFNIFDRLNEQLAALAIKQTLFRHAARDIFRRFRLEKQRRGQMGYDDLLTRLNDALHKPEGDRLAQVIGRQFPVALVDEFQDTDPIQYAAFGKVYLDRPEVGLFMIGDPKQAIYAFRGADIYTYLNARRHSGGNLYTLGTNYRSTGGMVASVNRMFHAAEDHSKGAFLFEDQIPFEPVEAHGREETFEVEGRPVESMHWWVLPQDKPVPKTTDKGYVARMAEAFASEIVRLLNLGQQQPPRAGFRSSDASLTPLRPADMAVLVRDWRQADAIRLALDRRNVRSVYLSDKESIFTSAEAMTLLYLLRACSGPKQADLLKTALATPLLDLPLTRLDALNQDETAWEAEVDRFSRFQQIWQRRGVLPMLRALLRAFGIPSRLLAMAGGERTLTNVLHLAELLQTASGDLDGEPALIRWLSEMIRHSGGGSDEQILRLESDDDLIRVITVHKSKGLEYPLVFLPFICTFNPVTQNQVARYHDENGQLKVAPEPKPGEVDAADEERLAEDLRLLYVAVTRARYACWLGIGAMGRGKRSTLHKSALGYLLNAGDPIAVESVTSLLEKVRGSCEHISIAPLQAADARKYAPAAKETALAPALVFTGRVPADWWVASYSAISAGASLSIAAESEAPASQGPPPEAHSAAEDQLMEAGTELPAPAGAVASAPSIHHFPRGPQPGTFLHGLLEWAAEEGFNNVAADAQRVGDKIQQLCEPRGWEAWTDLLAQWFGRLLQAPLTLPEDQGAVPLAQLATGHYQPELEFLFAAHQVDTRTLDRMVTDSIIPGARRPRLQRITVHGMLKGFIDLAFCHQGRYYVMDYKSNHLGEDDQAYGAQSMAEAMLEHRYDLQYVLYTLAMHRLLKARLPDYEYQRDMGGAIYVFLRGINSDSGGVYIDKPPWPLIQELDNRFAGREDDHAHG